MGRRSWLPKLILLLVLSVLILGSIFWVITISSVDCVKPNGCNKRDWDVVNQSLGKSILNIDLVSIKDQLKKDPSVLDVVFTKGFKKIKIDISIDGSSYTVGVVDVIDNNQSTQSATLTYKLQMLKSYSTQGPSKIYSLFKDGKIVTTQKDDFNFLVYASKPISQDIWAEYSKSFTFLSKIQTNKLVFLDKEGYVWLDSQVIMVFDITKDLQTIWDTLQQIRQASRIEDALLIDMRFKKPTITYLQGQ